MKHTAEKICIMAYKLLLLENGDKVEIQGSVWWLQDAADVTGVESKRGRTVLCERKPSGHVDYHHAYKWPTREELGIPHA